MNLIAPLRAILKEKYGQTVAKCEFLHNCLSWNSNPKGILPTLHIKMSPLLNNKLIYFPTYNKVLVCSIMSQRSQVTRDSSLRNDYWMANKVALKTVDAHH